MYESVENSPMKKYGKYQRNNVLVGTKLEGLQGMISGVFQCNAISVRTVWVTERRKGERMEVAPGKAARSGGGRSEGTLNSTCPAASRGSHSQTTI